jgi:hypothetical protein
MNTSPSLDIYNLDFLMRNMFVVPVHYITLQYPGGLIDTGEFRICVRSNNYDESACGTGYNSEAKQPEHVFIVEENRSSPDVDVDNQAQSQSQDNEQSQSQSQNNNQEQTTTIINCPPDSRCVIEQ